MTYTVVVNAEEQYSIWPEVKALPNGWRTIGFSGGREECLAHVAVVWTDIRPKSVMTAAS
ncbi:MbtH family NRPS accessory protein [Streptosporangium soli]|nr:MbtH family NRPS accessory protein [Streptosporangium sp. KLBMP 9127]